MRASFSSFVLSTMLLAVPCLADDELDIPVAAGEIPADALRPENIGKRIGDPTFFDRGTRAQVVLPLPLPLPPAVAVSSSSYASEPPAAPLLTSWKDDSATYNQLTVATVNGERILIGELLDRHAIFLRGFRENLQRQGRTQAEYNEQREIFVRQELPEHIERRLLAAAFTTRLSAQQTLEIDAFLDAGFIKQEEPRLMQELGVTTRDQLESALEAAGGSIKFTRKNYRMMQCSNSFLLLELNRVGRVSDDEVKAYYEDHVEDYARPATVDWEQIQITFSDRAAKAECLNRIQRAQKELQDRVPVADVVRKYSDGSRSQEGGVWKSMAAGSLADAKFEKFLFEMPLSQWSEIYEGQFEYQLVRVLKRTPAGTTPYEEVQDKIRQTLNAKKVQSLVQQSFSDADIEYDFDFSRLNQGSMR